MGISRVFATTREHYWTVEWGNDQKRILGMRAMRRRTSSSISQWLMASLLPYLTEKRWWVVSPVGVDYFGPALVRNGRKWEERNGCLFIYHKAIRFTQRLYLGWIPIILSWHWWHLYPDESQKQIYSEEGTKVVRCLNGVYSTTQPTGK